MKDYFKYANGFVNVNAENLFLTNSGNWSETHQLLEKSAKSIRQNTIKGFKIYIYLFVVLAIVLIMLTKTKNGVIPIVFIGFGIAAYTYMQRETGKRYKIPIAKITNIEFSDKEVKISFINLNNEADFEIIKNVEEKGISILKSIPFHN